MERRAHPRYRSPDIIVMVRVPESPLDFYFHATNISQVGLALASWSTQGFPLDVDTVLEMEVYSHLGTARGRGVVVRLSQGDSDEPRGFGVRIYKMADADAEIWEAIAEEEQKWGAS